eukprot:406020-Amphidinium_carterae.1
MVSAPKSTTQFGPRSSMEGKPNDAHCQPAYYAVSNRIDRNWQAQLVHGHFALPCGSLRQ